MLAQRTEVSLCANFHHGSWSNNHGSTASREAVVHHDEPVLQCNDVNVKGANRDNRLFNGQTTQL